MGIFKILGGIALGVGAVAAAPFTGGGSILGAATLVGSLTGASAVATGAAVIGGVAGAAMSAADEDDRRAEKKAAHESGFGQGIRKGNIEVAEKFAAMLKKDDNCRIGTFALAVYVANTDNDFTDEEKNEIECYLGRPDSTLNKNVRAEFMAIYNEIPSFSEVKSKYLELFSNSDLKELTDFIKAIINANGVVSPEEQKFLDSQWMPYLKDRGVA